MERDNEVGIGEQYSLEEILAEYKGNSYIDGDKKTPKDVLDEKTRRIVHEELGTEPPEAPLPRVDFEEIAAFLPKIEALAGDDDAPVGIDEITVPVDDIPDITPVEQEEEDDDFTEYAAPEADEPPARTIETLSADDADVAFFDNYHYSSTEPDEEIIRSVTDAIERETADQQAETRRPSFRLSEDKPFARRQQPTADVDFDNEPDYRERARKFASRCNSLSGRAIFALALSLVLVVFTFVAEGGGSLPFGIGKNVIAAGGLLLVIQLLVMLLGVDILILGARDAVRGSASAETLVFVSNAVSVLAGLFGMINGVKTLPYSAISALSLSFALWGERLYMEAFADSLRTAAMAAEPFSIISEFRRDLDRPILRKSAGHFKGFYGNLTQADVCETAHSYAVPLLLLAAVIAAVFVSVISKDYFRLPSVFASLTAASAAFTATLAFASPFRRTARRAKSVGAAIAGAGGADDIFYTEGFCVTDGDLYPPESLNVSNIRVLDHQVSFEKAIRYTASLVIASGSCLSRVFSDMLIKEGMSLITSQDFAASEGGVSALIRGENVLVGSFAFMNLFGIRVQDELKLGNSVYTAVNGRLIAMFSVDYRPNDRVRDSLNSLLRRGMRPSLTVRDFNITPMTIEQKFKLPMEDFDLLPISDVYSLGGEEPGGQGRAVAVCSRGGIRDLAEAVASGRRLKIVSMISTIVSVSSSVIGVMLMAVLGRASASGAARPGNLLIFMAVPLIITIVLELLSEASSGKG
ncbi:MAG: hypothetical protein LBN00_01395 [Oscillospiraceae bacterium]|jgi:hypothetical protein|nr:hypothetical protein [Oscillospiraceae bacterium]